MSAESVSLAINMAFSANVVLPVEHAESLGASGRTISRLGAPWSLVENFNANSTPVPTAILVMDLTLAAATFDIDLSAAAIIAAEDGSGEPAGTEDLDGKRLFAWMFSTIRSSGNNANPITIQPKAGATGYPLFGTGNAIELQPDSVEQQICKSSNIPLIDNAGAREIEIGGTIGEMVRILLAFEG